MDEFEMIAKSFRGIKVTSNRFEAATIVYGRWLVDEVERLRKIEDEALAWVSEGFTPEGGWKFHEALKSNPRPENADGRSTRRAIRHRPRTA